MASVSENAILAILKTAQTSKAADLDSLSELFLKYAEKYLVKPISSLCNLSIYFEKFPDLCKVAKCKPLYKKKGSLTHPCNYRPISLSSLISTVVEKVIHDKASTLKI